MGDQNHRHVELLFEKAELIENLFLDGDVEGGRRLIGDQQFRLAAEGHGNHDALLHPAGELVRVIVHALCWVDDAHHVEETKNLCVDVCYVWAMESDGFSDLLAYGENGVQRGRGLLEDVGDFFATNLSKFVFGKGEDGAAVEGDAAFWTERCGGCEEASEGEARDTFAAAAFPDDGESFAVIEMEGDVAYGIGSARARAEFYGEVADLKEGLLGHGVESKGGA